MERFPEPDGVVELDKYRSHGHEPVEKPVVNRRQKTIWEIPGGYHCSVIGTCLSSEELAILVRKSGNTVENRDDDYMIHSIGVTACKDKNELSTLIQRVLNKKFGRFITRYHKVYEEEAISEMWRDDIGRGDIAGPYWAIVSSPLVPEYLCNEIFGQVHMLSHLAGSSSRRELRKLKSLESINRSLERKLKKQKEISKEKKKKLQASREDFKKSETKNAILQRRLDAVEAGLRTAREREANDSRFAETEKLKTDLLDKENENRCLHDILSQYADRLEKIEDERHRLQNELTEYKTECVALEHQLLTNKSHDGLAGPVKDPGRKDVVPFLEGQRILYVGGRTNLASHYEELIKTRGGEFFHHDGGIEQSARQLQSMIDKADTVFCAIDRVSHSACLAVKDRCKNSRKRVIMLRSSGLSSLVRSLADLGGDSHCAAGGSCRTCDKKNIENVVKE
jgi:hypothetical protein